MIAVLGATGQQGGAVLLSLIQAGRAVRAVVRNPEHPYARALRESDTPVVVADLADVRSVTAAFEDASAVFAVTTPFEHGPQAEEEQGEAIIEAAGNAGISHLVLSSVASANQGTGIPDFESKAHIEHVLAATDLPATVVAPTSFYGNMLRHTEDVAAGRLPLALPADQRWQQTTRRDLAAVVTAITADPARWIGQRLEIASDEPTPAQMAAALSRAAGGIVRHQEVSLDELRQVDRGRAALFEFLSDTGFSVSIPRLRELFPDIEWTSFPAWALAQQWPVPRG